MKSDIEIAQEVELRPITEIAETAGIPDEKLEQYGKYKAKIDLSLLKDEKRERSEQEVSCPGLVCFAVWLFAGEMRRFYFVLSKNAAQKIAGEFQ